MALSTSENSIQPVPSPIGSYSNVQRAAPIGPRKVPDKLARHHTFDASSNLSSANRSSTNRSHTLPVHTEVNSQLLQASMGQNDPRLRKISSSQPPGFSDSASVDLGNVGRSFGSSSLLSAPQPSHSPLHTRAFPTSLGTASESRKSSVASIDRDPGAHLDLKRLLSKPAKHTPSSSSAISLPSDSEVSATSRTRAMAPQKSGSPHPNIQDKGGLPMRSLTANAKVTPPNRSGSRDTSSSSRNVEPEQNVRQRNVLRRRPSRSSTTPNTGAADALTSNAAPHSHPPKRRMRSIGAFHNSSAPSAADSVPSKTPSAPTMDAQTLKGLTPAGQVALAYKQQEQRREELEQLTGWSDQVHGPTTKTSAPVPSGSNQSLENLHAHDELNLEADEEEAHGPYYTVFGSSSGHVVAAGSPLDFSQQLDGYLVGGQYVRKPPRSLSRKVSGRFRKVADIVKRDREGSDSHGKGDGWRPFDGQSSAQRSPVRMSTDVDVATQSSSRRSTLTAKMSTHDRERSITEEIDEEEQSLYASRSGKDKDRDQDEEAHGKWWKLVKRISTGGLRDKYRQPHEATPPPVPPLPAHVQKRVETRRASEAQSSPIREGPGDGGVLLRFMQSRSSLSGARPATSPSQKTSSRHTSASRPSTGGKASTSPSAHRPSTTTRSSSPMSSDIASSGFFHRTHSTRSSASSYGEEVPPMPNTLKSGIAQHILGPNELRRFDTDRAREDSSTKDAAGAWRKSRKPSRSHSEPVDHSLFPSSADECMPLPLPPRRHGAGSRDRSAPERSPSPILPSFSTEGVVNNFSSPSLPLPEFGQAPPRPKRSSRRKPTSIELPPASVSSSVALNSPMTPRAPRPLAVSTDAHRLSSSTVNHASAGQQASSTPSSSATSPSSAASSHRSPLTFRELESPRQAWSEKEKADKWEDLLERSARAGGTLHLGETGLLSENMRLSQYSEI